MSLGRGSRSTRAEGPCAWVLSALVVVACSDPGPTTEEVIAVDFAYEGLPNEVVAGSTITMTNDSEVELHEFVAIRLPDEETRSVEELVADPEGLAAYFPNVAAVIIAPPGEDGITVEGSEVLSEPGRYAIICAIPTGADPAEYMAAAAESEGGPPDVAGGAPHFVSGMYAELTVEG